MSSWTTSAMRRSRKDLAAVSTASAAAFSHDSLLVPTSSITLYTLSAMVTSLDSVGYPLARVLACLGEWRSTAQRLSSALAQKRRYFQIVDVDRLLDREVEQAGTRGRCGLALGSRPGRSVG